MSAGDISYSQPVAQGVVPCYLLSFAPLSAAKGCVVPTLGRACRAVNVCRAAWLFAAIAFGTLLSAASADVVILSNRTTSTAKFSAASGPVAGKAYQLAAGDLMPLYCRPGESVRIAFFSAGKRRDYRLQGNSIYYFHHQKDSDEVDLEEIAVKAAGRTPGADPPPTSDAPPKSPAADPPPGASGPPPLTKVKVKILVDDDEKAVRAIWEPRLRKRIADASAILEKYARISLEVVACETWVTPNEMRGFDELMRNFETTVKAAPADIAIGFASQEAEVRGRTHMGGTRGPFATHVFLREWARRASEPERLELLVHELGHRFGATHSPEPTSVMRPILADRKSLAKSFRIVFDPVNALAMNLVAQEIREHSIEHFYQVGPRTRETLVAIYLTLGKAFPEDSAAAQYLAMLGEAPPATARRKLTRASTLIESAREVRDAVVDVADHNRRLPRTAPSDGGSARIGGDALTEAYVRAAATAALDAPAEHRTKAFALGLAVALADSDSLKSNSLIRDLLPNLETDDQRERRMAVIGAPTIQNRNDLARHFFLSAGIAALSNAAIAESAGLIKEMQDVQGESGFSFTDIAADFAGIALAEHVRNAPSMLRELGDSFQLAAFMPIVKGLPEGLSQEEFRREFGSTSDPRFLDEVALVRTRVKQLPVYSQSHEGSDRQPPPEKTR